MHGPSACATGWRVEDADKAFKIAVERGAKPAEGELTVNGKKIPAVYGVGDSLNLLCRRC